MPLYEYECETCGNHQDAVRLVDERDRSPECKCGASTVRVFSVQRSVICEDEVGWQPAFGKRFSNKHELRDEIRRLRDEKGIDMVEVGNDRARTKPKEVKYDHRAAYQMLRRMNRG